MQLTSVLLFASLLLTATTLVRATAEPESLSAPSALTAACCSAAESCVVSSAMEEMVFAHAPTPALCGLRAFSRETRYLSLAGYERWQQRLIAGTWTPLEDAVRQVRQDLALCPVR